MLVEIYLRVKRKVTKEKEIPLRGHGLPWNKADF